MTSQDEEAMTDKLDRFTKRARGALALAQEEALRLNHNYIGTEHLLLGLIGEEAGLAANVLKTLQIDFVELRQLVLRTVGRGERKPFGKPTLAPRAKQVIEYAVETARQLGHRYIGTEHLLLGLLQEGEGVGVRSLTRFVTAAAVAEKVTEVILETVSEKVISNQPADVNLAGEPGEGLSRHALAKVLGITGRPEASLPDLLPLVVQMRQALHRKVYNAAVQEERSRLARDLHDSIKQQLFTINVSAAAASERLDKDLDGARAALADVQQSAQAAMVEMNALLHQLSPAPLASAGLLEALHQQCEALSYRTGAEVTTAFSPLPPAECLPLGTQETIFRIAQEALSNVARHARAQRVHVRLDLVDEGNTVRLEIRDDGQGFEPAKTAAGMGLANIQARAERLNGRADVTSAPGQGTTLRIDIPLLEIEDEQSA